MRRTCRGKSSALLGYWSNMTEQELYERLESEERDCRARGERGGGET